MKRQTFLAWLWRKSAVRRFGLRYGWRAFLGVMALAFAIVCAAELLVGLVAWLILWGLGVW